VLRYWDPLLAGSRRPVPEPPLRKPGPQVAVYDHAMGLFRRRRRDKSGTATAGLLTEQTEPATAQPEAQPEALPEALPEAQPEVPRREVTAEARPNPDQPGWGRALGQQIGRAREDRSSQ
jgi:hypothetical protein